MKHQFNKNLQIRLVKNDTKYHEFGAHFRYKDLVNKLITLCKERDVENFRESNSPNKRLYSKNITTDFIISSLYKPEESNIAIDKIILPEINNYKTRNSQNLINLTDRKSFNNYNSNKGNS